MLLTCIFAFTDFPAAVFCTSASHYCAKDYCIPIPPEKTKKLHFLWSFSVHIKLNFSLVLCNTRSVHLGKSSGKLPEKLKSKLTLRYTAAKLHEKGVLLEVDGLPTTQFRNVQFEISPTDHNGVFTICGKFMGVELEKVEIDIQVSQ